MPFADAPENIKRSSLPEVDRAIDGLYEKRDAWVATPIAERIALLEKCVTGIASVAERWASIGARIKGLSPDEPLSGEEWIAGIVPTIRNARLLVEALRANGARKPQVVRALPSGQLVARVHPASLMERLMFTGVTADVWIQKDKPASQGAAYREKGKGRVCLVLGGGNVSSIPPMDAFYKLFVENEVVLLKMNPVNEALAPVIEEALRPLVDHGVLAVVTGGADVGAHAAQHPKVESLHVTGSDRTYDAIVWGGAEGKARGERVNDKDFSAELGCVTPVLVVPGAWSDGDLRFQARHVASMVTQNASFNCNAAKVIVTARGWLQRTTFLEMVHEELKKTRARKAYYPGAQERYRAFVEQYPNAVVLGDAQEGSVPWTAIPNVSSEKGTYALTNEAFCGVVAEVALDLGDDHVNASPARFLEEAVKFANERCWGTLSCCVLVDPHTQEEHEDAIARAITDLRYGGIGVNVWPGLIYGLVAPTWGAFPGHTASDIQSGTGVVHNTYMFDHPEKSVVRAPFRMSPTPPWFSDHRNLKELGKRLVAFEAKPSWGGFVSVVLAALKG